jgi:hypothetical protein
MGILREMWDREGLLPETTQDLVDEFSAQAKTEGTYDGRASWEVAATPGSILDVPETPESQARIRPSNSAATWAWPIPRLQQ